MEVGQHIAEASIEATITRADGTVEHLGIIDEYKRPWWRTLMARFTTRH